MLNKFDKDSLDKLRESIGALISPRRFKHTLGVEKMALILGNLYCPDKLDVLSAAALLHDFTKELTVAEHMEIFNKYGIEVSVGDKLSVSVLHSKTAALTIPEKFPEFADEEVISAVKWHTTGRENMSICEKLIYLADYIDETRDYEDCVVLRNTFFDAEPEKMTAAERKTHLDKILILSFDMTLRDLIQRNRIVSEDTISARNYLILNLKN